MIYLIDPIDNFFFRTPIPFEAGGETAQINSVFPPLPSVYAGAFRTLMEDCEGVRLKIGCNGLWLKDSLYFLNRWIYTLAKERTEKNLSSNPWSCEKKHYPIIL